MHIHGVRKSGYKLPPSFWGRACTISIHPSMARGCSIIITPDGVTSNGGEGGRQRGDDEARLLEDRAKGQTVYRGGLKYASQVL